MEKEKILLADMLEYKNELVETKRNIIFITDLFLQKKEEYEDKNGNVNLEKSKFFEIAKSEIDELTLKIQEGLKDFTFDNCFDLFKNFKETNEIIISDIQLINSFLKTKMEFEIYEFNLVRLDVSKKIINLILNNYDQLTNNLKQIID